MIENGNTRTYQSRSYSFYEQIVAQLITLVIAMITAELFVYKMFNMQVTTSQNIGFMLYFFGQNVCIRYFIRRYCEKYFIGP